MFFQNLREDVRMYTRVEKAAAHKALTLFVNLGFHSVVLYRLSSWLYRRRLAGLGLAVSYWNGVWTGCHSGRAKIGPGLVILHPSGIVVGATAVVGRCCMFAGRNSIGQRDNSGLRPVLGDGCLLGAGACVIGPVSVGNNCRVGPNVVLDHSIPDDSTAVCEPPRVRQRKPLATHLKSARSTKRTDRAHEAATQVPNPGLFGTQERWDQPHQ